MTSDSMARLPRLYTLCSPASPRRCRWEATCWPVAVLACASDVGGRKPVIVLAVTDPAKHLGHQHDPLTLPALVREPAADNFLGPSCARAPGPAVSVDVGGIDQVDPHLDSAIEDRVAFVLARLWAEVHSPERQTAHLQASASEVGVLHGVGQSSGGGSTRTIRGM